ncbi:hypothetical protein DPX16_1670 [Anabarilius grahami]|uniref:Uncharacterized protein n=1 Tax=Anabarilius grahami TaxID=495550 RepID=A0A3N0Y2N0_ANAGA|nr:hypothetical protein DPX16_1670 [Anabarilius grahami]
MCPLDHVSGRTFVHNFERTLDGPFPVFKQVLKLEVESDQNVNDPDMKAAILEEFVDTAAIAELEYCDAEAYKTLREKFHRGQKLSEFVKQCKEMCTREPLRSIIEEKKKNGMLVDLCQKKIP